jgi:hypothetical protein
VAWVDILEKNLEGQQVSYTTQEGKLEVELCLRPFEIKTLKVTL